MNDRIIGTIRRVNGPVVEVAGVTDAMMMELVHVGNARLTGEVVKLAGGEATVQVYEDTTGVTPGEDVAGTGMPLGVELGPGLIGTIYDGIQRPLERLREHAPVFIERGLRVEPLDLTKRWRFVPSLREGETVERGDIVGTVQETPQIEHRVMVPEGVSGRIASIAAEGEYTIDETVAVVEDADGERRELSMRQRWPIRVPRPSARRLRVEEPLVTGQRVIDTLFPLGKGGAVAIPGGFGTGKTMTQHAIAKWCDADIIVYIGCGERGNEMTDVLTDFPELVDPRTGHSLMERTILIANTSNMPVSAREASIYTGITLAEYYRDQGYDVAVMADSTSRWAEALRELSGRMEEMPAEEGFRRTCPPASPSSTSGPAAWRPFGGRRSVDHRRGLSPGRRLLRTGHPAHQAFRALFLGARPAARQCAPLSGDRLAGQLQRVSRRPARVVGRARRTAVERRPAPRSWSCSAGGAPAAGGQAGRSGRAAGQSAVYDRGVHPLQERVPSAERLRRYRPLLHRGEAGAMLALMLTYWRRGAEAIKERRDARETAPHEGVQDIARMKFTIANDEIEKIDRLQARLERSIDQLESVYA